MLSGWNPMSSSLRIENFIMIGGPHTTATPWARSPEEEEIRNRPHHIEQQGPVEERHIHENQPDIRQEESGWWLVDGVSCLSQTTNHQSPFTIHPPALGLARPP